MRACSGAHGLGIGVLFLLAGQLGCPEETTPTSSAGDTADASLTPDTVVDAVDGDIADADATPDAVLDIDARLPDIPPDVPDVPEVPEVPDVPDVPDVGPDIPPGPEQPPAPAFLGFVTSPSPVAFIGRTWRYQVSYAVVGSPTLTIVQGPAGMSVGPDGRTLSWSPAPDQLGNHRVRLLAELAELTGTQELVVTATTATPAGAALIGPAGGFVEVPAGSNAAGARLTVAAGALPVEVPFGIHSVAAEIRPAALSASETLHPLLLTPTGAHFALPARIQVPYDASLDAAAAAGELRVHILDEDDGDWDSLTILALDPVARLAEVETSHLSVVVAGRPLFATDLAVLDQSDAESCARDILATFTTPVTLDAVPVGAVEHLPSTGASDVAALLASGGFTGSVRVLRVVELLGPGGVVAASDAVAVTIQRRADGSGLIAIAGPDAFVDHWAPLADVAGEISAWEPLLRGVGLSFRFDAEVGSSVRVRARTHVRFDPGNAAALPFDPSDQGRPLTDVTRDVSVVVGPTAVDIDCDGVDDALDGFMVTGRPEVVAGPAGFVVGVLGEPVEVACAAGGVDGSEALPFTLSSSEGTDTLSPVGAKGASVTAASLGTRTITCATEWQGAALFGRLSLLVVPAEAPCGGACDDGNGCTQDACVAGLGVCVSSPTAGPCEDGEACTVGDACEQGVCVSGALLDCDDGDVCTTDACTTQGACTYIENTAPCNDGNACTSGDVCAAGVCKGGANACLCSQDADCALFDGPDLCAGRLECASGVCAINPATIPAPCPASGTSCWANECDPGSGLCVAALAGNGTLCDDGDACTAVDRCTDGTCAGPAVDCDDGQVCTTESCVEGTGCVSSPAEGPCDDGNACTDGDTCVAGACTPGNNTCACGDDSDCAPAEDSNPCNGTLICVANGCVVDPASVVVCPALGACEVSSCNPATGACELSFAVSGAACDDGDACTGGDTCAAGVCNGTPVACPGGAACNDGVCSTCTPACEGKVCGPDGCDGSCGSCAANEVCSGAGQCDCVPACDGRACGADGCGSTCGECAANEVCSDQGQCDCAPACDGKVCGADGCGGSCGDCAADELCNDEGQCGCAPACDGKVCGDDGCGSTCGECAANEVCNDEGQCDCVPACDGKVCGDDGCGGSCGDCAAGELCDAAGQCVCAPACDGKVCGDDGCGSTCGECAANEVCNDEGQCDCVPACDGKVCGADGCEGSCGDCAANEACNDAGQCDCVPACDGKVCGADGCGGSCGECTGNSTCTAAGQCECVADCAGRVCGSDGCEGSCGGCEANEACNQDGLCVCLPSCAGKQCGSDGCEGSCGACAANALCTPAGHCECVPDCEGKACGADGCGGSCGLCDAGDACNDAFECECVPVCDGKVCGPDLCGSVCGTCGAAEGCFDGACLGCDPAGCDDGNDCTVDTCRPAPAAAGGTGGICEHEVDADLDCDDGNACTNNDFCWATLGGCAGFPANCDDQDPCTVDSCDRGSGCLHEPVCAATDVCVAGLCFAPVGCVDDDDCDNQSPCSVDSCVAGACATVPVCDDRNPCTEDACDEASGACSYDGVSNNGDACEPTTLDHCRTYTCAAGECRPSAPVVCDDSDPCSDDFCASAFGCLARPDVTRCDDGDPCTVDGCDPVDGCTNQVLVCPDGEACVLGQCEAATPCVDDAECAELSADLCVPTLCLDGVCRSDAIDCDDQDACTLDRCADGQCGHSPNDDAPCDDGDACTVGDFCAPIFAAGCGGLAVDCDDDDPCTVDACDDQGGCAHDALCTAGEVCFQGACVAIVGCTLAEECTDLDDCTNDFCVDGACAHAPKCDDGDACTADSCDPATAACTNDYAAAEGAPCEPEDGDRCTLYVCGGGACVASEPLACDDGNPCTGDYCHQDFGCVSPLDSAICDDDDPCTDDGCDTVDGCWHDPVSCPDGELCALGECIELVACGVGLPCPVSADPCVPNACVAGACVPAPVDCDDDDLCTVEECRGGVCRTQFDEGAPCDDGDACSDGDFCSHLFSGCGGFPVGCDDGDPCTADSCDDALGCVNAPVCAASDRCVQGLCFAVTGCIQDGECDDVLACTSDTCQDGACINLPRCDDEDDCTADSCDPTTGACSHDPAPLEGAACTSDDPEPCIAYACAAGACAAAGPVPCDDGNPCTADGCDPVFGCVTPPDAAICADNNPCTVDTCDPVNGCSSDPLECPIGELCALGVCISEVQCSGTEDCPASDDACVPTVCTAGFCVPEPVECGDDNICTTDACVEGSCENTFRVDDPCDDEDDCTSADRCDVAAGSCVGDSVDCDDQDACTVDGCAADGGCSHTPLCVAGEVCVDGGCYPIVGCSDDAECADTSPCTDDSCVSAACVNVPACDDDNPCTANDCDEGTGACSFDPNPADGAACDPDAVDRCHAYACDDGACVAGAPVGCDDFNSCTTDLCDATAGCFAVPDAAACDDQDPCTVDVCDPVNGCSVDPVECPPGQLCALGACIEEIGCGDVSACPPAADLCVPFDCVGGVCLPVPIVCDDQDACTIDSCDAGVCIAIFDDGGACDDSDDCTSGDMCSQLFGGCGGAVVHCNDDDPCTSDGCLPAGGCTHDAVCSGGDVCVAGQCFTPTGCAADGDCADPDLCTADSCVDGACVHLPTCVDDDPCTEDLCDQASGACTFESSGSDGLACAPLEPDICQTYACQAGACQPFATVPCDDGDPCAADFCDPAYGCVSLPDPGACDDDNACTIDTCDSVLGCANMPVACPVGQLCALGNCIDVVACDGDGGCPASADPCLPASCVGGNCVPGAIDPCDDDDDCTIDACSPSVSGPICTHTFQADVPCDDGEPCTYDGVCLAGEGCVGIAYVCDDSDPCTVDICDGEAGCNEVPFCPAGEVCLDAMCYPDVGCTTAADCADGNLCSDDICLQGACLHSVRCLDDNPCTFDDCVFETGACINDAAAMAGAPCVGDVGDACSVLRCSAGACVEFDRVDCDDQDACTTDACDAVTGGCSNTPDVSHCNDQDPCTIDLCNQTTGCYSSDIVCGVDEVCDEGVCRNILDCDEDADCPPGPNLCTPLTCVDGSCVETPTLCDDGDDQCTTDACNLSSGECKFSSVGACSDGNLCTIDDYCYAGGTGCLGRPRQCDDFDPCTVDSCQAALGCQTVPLCAAGETCHEGVCFPQDGCADASECDDGQICTTDLCIAGSCVHHFYCADHSACTQDSCDAAGNCTNDPVPLVGSSCSGENACKTYECSATGFCEESSDVECVEDDNPCTVQRCDAYFGRCIPVADWTECDDDDACTIDSCHLEDGCIHEPFPCGDGHVCYDDVCIVELPCSVDADCPAHPDVCTAYFCTDNLCIEGLKTCDDSNVCTDDSCDEGAGGCVNAGVAGRSCDDLDACTSVDVCDAAGACGGGPLCDVSQTCNEGVCAAIPCNGILYFSEYVEGGELRKGLEIFNGTSADLDMSSFEIWGVTNGGTWPEQTWSLSGILAAGDVLVVCHSGLDAVVPGVCDIVEDAIALFNGDDARALVRNGVMFDVIGVDGPDVGVGWEVGGVPDATQNHTLRRKPEVHSGNTDWTAAAASEWEVLPSDTLDGLGTHSPVYSCQPPD